MWVWEGFMDDSRRRLPAVDDVLTHPLLASQVTRLGRGFVKSWVRDVLDTLRDCPPPVPLSAAELAATVHQGLPTAPVSMRPVINATGVIIHTNLGRAPLSAAAREAMVVAGGATDVELDLHSGKRGPRGQATIKALEEAVGLDVAAHVVNNGAGGIMLACFALASGGNVVISRGEMVEIGDGFRIPELMTATGVELREVGTTNRTHLRDYEHAVDDATGFIIKVHPSNFQVEGFTSGVSIGQLANSFSVPIVADIGSGLLRPHPRLPQEPDARSVLRQGADLVVASGDKLLGGPQAGVLIGQESLITRLRRHPLARAVRVDKFTLAALEATVLGPPTPVAQALQTPVEDLRERAERIASAVGGALGVQASVGAVGGGGAPGVELESVALVLPADLAHPLRTGTPAVMGRVSGGDLLIDLLAVAPDQDEHLIEAVRTVLDGHP